MAQVARSVKTPTFHFFKKIPKSLALLAILIIALSNMIIAETAYAQSTKPSPPEFTVRLVHASYSVVDRQTGVSRQIDNSSIEFKIKNQPFAVSSTVNAIYYLVQVRNPATGYWSPIYSTATYHIQSNTTYTILTMPISLPNLLPPPLRNATSVDFQLQAQTGYYSQTYKQGQMPNAPIQTNGYWETNFNPAEKSDWSTTQTVNLDETAASPNPIPTAPEFSWLAVLPLFILMLFIALKLKHKRPILTQETFPK